MNEFELTLINTFAPLLVQLLGALVLAAASAVLLKSRMWIDAKLTEQQQASLQRLATTAVHLAEVEGIGKSGIGKARAAQDYVNSELAAIGMDTIKTNNIEATVIGAVQQAWSDQIGETYHRPADPWSAPTPIGTPGGLPTVDS